MLVGAPGGCHASVHRLAEFNAAQGQQLGESFFNSLNASSDFGAQFANKVFVKCP